MSKKRFSEIETAVLGVKMSRKILLEIKDIVIPSRKLDYSQREGCRADYVFSPSKIISLADRTGTAGNGSYAQSPNLLEVDYSKVEKIALDVQGYNGGASCPIISKEDFEKLKKAYFVSENKDMIGKSVTVVYDDTNRFAGFIPQRVWFD